MVNRRLIGLLIKIDSQPNRDLEGEGTDEDGGSSRGGRGGKEDDVMRTDRIIKWRATEEKKIARGEVINDSVL